MADNKFLLRQLKDVDYEDSKNKLNSYLKLLEEKNVKFTNIFDNLVKEIISIQTSNELKDFYDTISDIIEQLYDTHESLEDDEKYEYVKELDSKSIQIKNKFFDLNDKLKIYKNEISDADYDELFDMIDKSENIILRDVNEILSNLLY